MKTMFVILIALSSVACAPATIEGLRKDHANSYTFEVGENYQPIYRKILSTARKCYQTGMITAQMVVQGDLYHDIKSGNVTVALHGGFGVDTHMTIDISALNDEKTRIVVFNAISTWNSAGRAVREWVEENSTQCRPRNS